MKGRIEYIANFDDMGPPENASVQEVRSWFEHAQLVGETPVPAVMACVIEDLLRRLEALS